VEDLGNLAKIGWDICGTSTELFFPLSRRHHRHCEVHGTDEFYFQETLEAGSASHLLVIADGMGGHENGEIASRMALETLSSAIGRRRIPFDVSAAILEAHQRICQFANGGGQGLGMGTTVAEIWLNKCGAKVFNVGDSRVYCFRGFVIEQLSADDVGAYKGSITQCLGGGIPTDPVPHLCGVDFNSGDGFFVVSDGVSDVLSTADFLEIWVSKEPEDMASTICNLAVRRGSGDDVSVLAIKKQE
tara:strand:+ start:498 stop:1232 length:735 start_codon:yes stop_codon:yes gene_type:complete